MNSDSLCIISQSEPKQFPGEVTNYLQEMLIIRCSSEGAQSLLCKNRFSGMTMVLMTVDVRFHSQGGTRFCSERVADPATATTSGKAIITGD